MAGALSPTAPTFEGTSKRQLITQPSRASVTCFVFGGMWLGVIRLWAELDSDSESKMTFSTRKEVETMIDF